MTSKLVLSIALLSAGAAFAQTPTAPPTDAANAPASPVAAAQPASAGAPPYKVVDGNKVDAFTMKGFRAWRAGACDRCHGPNQEGLVGPSLINGLKTLSEADFMKTVHDGRLDKGMPSFADSPTVMGGLENLYAYLKGRSDGAITSARVEEIK
jgi:mono/diheme cytochrome c family protein